METTERDRTVLLSKCDQDLAEWRDTVLAASAPLDRSLGFLSDLMGQAWMRDAREVSPPELLDMFCHVGILTVIRWAAESDEERVDGEADVI